MPSKSSGDGGSGRSIRDTIRDHVRGMVGGLLVGLPLLWTQEMWDNGATLAPQKLLVLLAAAFVITLGFNAVSGFRRERRWIELVIDTVQGLGLAVLLAAGVLFILGRFEPEIGVGALVGRVALQAIPVSFGVALAATVLSDSEDAGGREAVGPVGELFVAAGGALYFALNIAPTDEVRRLGSEADTPLLLIGIGASLALALATLYTLGQGPRNWLGDGPLDGAVGEAIASYAVALVVAYLLLWAFGIVDGLGPRAVAGHLVLLSVAAAFGAAAGRVLIGDGSNGSADPAR